MDRGLPAGEAQLPKLKVDGIGLVTACRLAVGEKEVVAGITWQRDAPSSGCWPYADLVL